MTENSNPWVWPDRLAVWKGDEGEYRVPEDDGWNDANDPRVSRDPPNGHYVRADLYDAVVTELDLLRQTLKMSVVDVGADTPLWPDPKRPGFPLAPTENGVHQLTHTKTTVSTKGPWVMLWHGIEQLWTDVFGNRMSPDEVATLRYLGSCVPPIVSTIPKEIT